MFVDVNPTRPLNPSWLGHLAADAEVGGSEPNCAVVPIGGAAPLCALVATAPVSQGDALLCAVVSPTGLPALSEAAERSHVAAG